MAVVCMVNFKGGVGKTTLCLALADFLSGIHQRRVLLIDLDPQANLSFACVGEERWGMLDKKELTVADAFRQVSERRPRVLHVEMVSRVARALPVAVVVSTPRLTDVETDILGAPTARGARAVGPYDLLREALGRNLAAYDDVIIDCPPSLGVITLNGLAMADGWLVPVMPTPVAVAGVPQLFARVQEFTKTIGHPLRKYGTIINAYSAGTNLHASTLHEVAGRKEFQPVWNTRIRYSVRLGEGYAGAGPKTLSQRWGTAYADLLALAEEYTRRV